ncbi:MAG: hypothetical protein M3Z57_00390 [Candidatus Dormibacteraeota bacterium]|nr:hypothetical protein [Candidatus Dormibacteraeota bacterium]
MEPTVPESGSPIPPPPPAAGATVGGPPAAPRPRLGAVRPGQAALLVVAAITLVEGIGVAIAGSDVHLSGILALAIGGCLFAVAMFRRLLGAVPEIRSLLAVVGTLLISAAAGLLTDGTPVALRMAIAGVVAIGLAGLAAQRIPSAVAAALGALAVIVTPALVIAIAGAPVVGAALGGGLGLALVLLGGWVGPRLAHARAAAWLTGTGALVGALIVSYLAQLDGGVAIAAAAFGAVGLVTAAQRRRSVVLGFAAFFLISATVAQAAIASGGASGSIAAVLIVSGVLLSAAAVLAGAFSSRLLVISGAANLPVRFEDLVIALAAVLALVSATGTPGGAFNRGNPFTPSFGSSGSLTTSAPAPVPTDSTPTPVPTDVNGVPCPVPQAGVVPPDGC